MSISEYLYIFSICLQVAGAEILILNYWKMPSASKLAKKELESKYDFGDIDEEDDSKDYFEEIKTILINRIAFIKIALGYLIGIFGNLNDNTNRGCIFLIVLVISFLICGGSYYVASLCAKKRAKADK